MMEKGCELGFRYRFLTDFIKNFLLGSMLLDFGFLTEEASWIYRIFKIWCDDKKNYEIWIRLKFKGVVRFSQNLVSHITQYKCIYTQKCSSINWNLPSVKQFWESSQNLKKFERFNRF